TKLTPVLFFLAFGSLMVNLGILPHESTEFIRGFAEIGIILIMFALGFEEDTSAFVKGIKRSWGIALFGALAPFAAAYLIIMHYWGEPRLAIICGLAMTATAVSLTMVSLKSENLHKSGAATGIMTSAILDDIASLAAVAIIIPMATGEAEITLIGVSAILIKAVLFFCVITLLELIIFPHESDLALFRVYPFLRRFGMRGFIGASKGEHATLVVLLTALLISLLSFQFGFHPAVGAYMAGLIIKQEYFRFHPHSTSPLADSEDAGYVDTKRIIDNVAFSWIGPVFFVELGTKITFDIDVLVGVIPHIISLTLGILFAQIISASLAARYTGNFKWHESIMIGFGMLGRAELAFVVMDIGYVQNGVITTDAFYTLMATAFFLNVSVPVLIKWWKPYFAGEKHLVLSLGKKRLELSNSDT
ncbi:MAG: Kef-type K+ transport system membrane component KefB, partial [Pseudohongiellaceae bacterium]